MKFRCSNVFCFIFVNSSSSLQFSKVIQRLNYAVSLVFPDFLLLNHAGLNSDYEFRATPTIIQGIVSHRVLQQLYGNPRYEDIWRPAKRKKLNHFEICKQIYVSSSHEKKKLIKELDFILIINLQ